MSQMTLNRITYNFLKSNKLKTNKDSYDVIFDIKRELKNMLPNNFFLNFLPCHTFPSTSSEILRRDSIYNLTNNFHKFHKI